jgi:hypothetical protein
MWPPPLLADRPPALRVGIVLMGPIAFGALCGWLLGVSEGIYITVTVLGIVGAVTNGYEHLGWRAGLWRGVASGVLTALAILLTNEIIGADPEAKLPDPHILLAVIFGCFAGGFGALGGVLRLRGSRAPA